jgi:phage/plasmid primase-like uncharacterized protein
LGCGYPLSLADGRDGRLLAHCVGGDSYHAVRAALVPFGLLDGDDDCGIVDQAPRRDPERDVRRSEDARRLYDSFIPAAGSVVEAYLRSRGISLEVPAVLRFGIYHHRIGINLPAMLAPIVDATGLQIGCHATFLRPDGSGKAELGHRDLQRECAGVVRGGAIRLFAHDAGCELAVAEGIESALSAAQLFDVPAWSAVSAGGMKTLALPPAVRRVLIAADRDVTGVGQRNALAAYERWTAEGRLVRIKMPPTAGADFNDVVRRTR